MLLSFLVRLAVLAYAVLWRGIVSARPPTIQLCGRDLSKFMSRHCHSYNSPWRDAVQPSGVIRNRRDVGGITDECCKKPGCGWDQISQYCEVVTNSAELQDPHQIADRSAEASMQRTVEEPPPESPGVKVGEVGRRRARGYARARRCQCPRRRRAGRRRPVPIGNMDVVKVVSRAAPVVGTVSPLLTWGRTMHAELHTRPYDHVAYVTV